jgi:hypothetical protein
MATPGVFPTDTAGGLVIRDAAGAPTNPAGVENAYVPAAGFVITCPPTGLPSDCTARIEPRQINAIVSELLSFAECLDPNGPWDCNSLKNLCAAFQAWAILNVKSAIISDTAPVPPDAEHARFWWESDTGILWIYYDDGSSAQWVQVAGPQTVLVMDQISIIGAGDTADPHSVGLVDCGTWS